MKPCDRPGGGIGAVDLPGCSIVPPCPCCLALLPSTSDACPARLITYEQCFRSGMGVGMGVGTPRTCREGSALMRDQPSFSVSLLPSSMHWFARHPKLPLHSAARSCAMARTAFLGQSFLVVCCSP
eukprot:UN2429